MRCNYTSMSQLQQCWSCYRCIVSLSLNASCMFDEIHNTVVINSPHFLPSLWRSRLAISFSKERFYLTHCPLVTHAIVSAPVRCQAITWTNAANSLVTEFQFFVSLLNERSYTSSNVSCRAVCFNVLYFDSVTSEVYSTWLIIIAMG